jgi:hypothetical protein
MQVQISQLHSSGGAALGSQGSEMSMRGDLMEESVVDVLVRARSRS